MRISTPLFFGLGILTTRMCPHSCTAHSRHLVLRNLKPKDSADGHRARPPLPAMCRGNTNSCQAFFKTPRPNQWTLILVLVEFWHRSRTRFHVCLPSPPRLWQLEACHTTGTPCNHNCRAPWSQDLSHPHVVTINLSQDCPAITPL